MKKRLKEDEFVSTLTKIFDFAKKKSRELMIGAIAVAIVILAFLVSNALKAQSVKRDSRVLAEILEIESQLDENPDKLAELEALAGKGKFSRIAYLKLASYWIEQGNSENAKSHLEKISDKSKDLIYYQAQDMLAQVYMHDKDFDKAIAIYKSIEEDDEQDYALDAVLYRMAEAHEEKGELDIALELYKRVQDEYPQTFFGLDASKKVSELEEKK